MESNLETYLPPAVIMTPSQEKSMILARQAILQKRLLWVEFRSMTPTAAGQIRLVATPQEIRV